MYHSYVMGLDESIYTLEHQGFEINRDYMEKDVLKKFKMGSRDEAVRFLKSLWNERPQQCPLCDGKLDYLHKKAKKSNCDWICTVCGERYDTIKILNQLNEN